MDYISRCSVLLDYPKITQTTYMEDEIQYTTYILQHSQIKLHYLQRTKLEFIALNKIHIIFTVDLRKF